MGTSLEYAKNPGYLGVGSDLLNGTFGVLHAQKLCDELTDCMGFTLAARHPRPNLKYHIWLKASSEWVPHEKHLTFLKRRPDCSDVQYTRMIGVSTMQRSPASHYGPYCCEGSGCPANLEGFAEVQRRCNLPAATPAGLPLCSKLEGEQLPNVALRPGNEASISSAWPHPENSGAQAAIDGIVDARYFHTNCRGDRQWFRLTFDQPMAVAQLVVHNRPDMRSRLVGARVILLHPNRTVIDSLRLGSARKTFVLTLNETKSSVGFVEVVSAQRDECMHFSEIEVFGAPQAEVERGARLLPLLPYMQAGLGASRTAPLSTPPDLIPRSREQATPSDSTEQELTRQRGRSCDSAIATESRSAVLIASAGSATAIVFLAIQALWIKAQWLDLWR